MSDCIPEPGVSIDGKAKKKKAIKIFFRRVRYFKLIGNSTNISTNFRNGFLLGVYRKKQNKTNARAHCTAKRRIKKVNSTT